MLALSYWMPVEGPWIDTMLSRRFSGKLHIKIWVHHASVRRWRNIDFDSLDLEVATSSSTLHSGPGNIRLKAFPWPTRDREEAVVVMRHLVIPADLSHKFPSPFLSKIEILNQTFVADKIKLSISRANAGIGYHLLECVSKEFNLKGGVIIAESKVSRVHALLLIRENILNKLPVLFRSRLIQRPEGWRGLRVLYHRNTLTAIGAKGPFFRANWR